MPDLPEYVSIKVANYALVDVIEALFDGGLTEFTITKEDNDLVLVIKISKLKKLKIKNLERSYTSNGRID